jgi:hypothetical protein
MAMTCEEARKWCAYCNAYRWFYRYAEGASRQWICTSCSNSYYCGGGHR